MTLPVSSKPRLFLVDVFAERAYAGNQLAVVVGADPADWPSARMQDFAREMNFSETTFAAPSTSDGAFDVRIFTPAEELPFAGHPTLGSAWVLRHHFAGSGLPASVALRLPIGVVPVEFSGSGKEELVRMRPRPPTVGEAMDGAEMAAHLGLDLTDLDARHPCRRVEVGVQFVIVPVRDLAALRRVVPRSLPSAPAGTMLGILALAPQPYEKGGDLSVRVFFDALGIREDPATGSAGACLAAYLSAQRYLGSETVKACVQQGYEMKRPSQLYLEAEPRNGEDRSNTVAVSVGGKVILVASGELA